MSNVETPTLYTQPGGGWITEGRTSQARPSRLPYRCRANSDRPTTFSSAARPFPGFSEICDTARPDSAEVVTFEFKVVGGRGHNLNSRVEFGSAVLGLLRGHRLVT